MHHYINIIKDTPFTEDEINTAVNLSTIGLLEDETKYLTYEISQRRVTPQMQLLLYLYIPVTSFLKF